MFSPIRLRIFFDCGLPQITITDTFCIRWIYLLFPFVLSFYPILEYLNPKYDRKATFAANRIIALRIYDFSPNPYDKSNHELYNMVYSVVFHCFMDTIVSAKNIFL